MVKHGDRILGEKMIDKEKMDWIDVFNKNEKSLDADYNKFLNTMDKLEWMIDEVELHEALINKAQEKLDAIFKEFKKLDVIFKEMNHG